MINNITILSFMQDFTLSLERASVQGFDLTHQVWRLRYAKLLPDRETELIMRTLAEQVQTYEQVVEVSRTVVQP